MFYFYFILSIYMNYNFIVIWILVGFVGIKVIIKNSLGWNFIYKLFVCVELIFL